jgi:hypothetical protein
MPNDVLLAIFLYLFKLFAIAVKKTALLFSQSGSAL